MKLFISNKKQLKTTKRFIKHLLFCSFSAFASENAIEKYVNIPMLYSALTHESHNPHVGAFFSEMCTTSQNSGSLNMMSCLIDELTILDHPTILKPYECYYHYEALEFLGDSLLDAIVSVYLFYNFGRSFSEGFLTHARSSLVKNKSLQFYAKTLGIEYYRQIGHLLSSYLTKDQSDKINADMFEAIMGALCLSPEFQKSGKDFVYMYVCRFLENLVPDRFDDMQFAVTNLPEYFLVDSPFLDLITPYRPDILQILEDLEVAIKYKIKNRMVFIQALNSDTNFLYPFLE